MGSDAIESGILSHACQVDADEFVVIPSGAELYRERDFHGGADGFENLPNERRIAQQARATVTLDDFLCRTAEVQVDEIEAEVLDHTGGICEHARIAAE